MCFLIQYYFWTHPVEASFPQHNAKFHCSLSLTLNSAANSNFRRTLPFSAVYSYILSTQSHSSDRDLTTRLSTKKCFMRVNLDAVFRFIDPPCFTMNVPSAFCIHWPQPVSSQIPITSFNLGCAPDTPAKLVAYEAPSTTSFRTSWNWSRTESLGLF